jgi:hypothetical protein
MRSRLLRWARFFLTSTLSTPDLNRSHTRIALLQASQTIPATNKHDANHHGRNIVRTHIHLSIFAMSSSPPNMPHRYLRTRSGIGNAVQTNRLRETMKHHHHRRPARHRERKRTISNSYESQRLRIVFIRLGWAELSHAWLPSTTSARKTQVRHDTILGDTQTSPRASRCAPSIWPAIQKVLSRRPPSPESATWSNHQAYYFYGKRNTTKARARIGVQANPESASHAAATTINYSGAYHRSGRSHCKSGLSRLGADTSSSLMMTHEQYKTGLSRVSDRKRAPTKSLSPDSERS